MVGALLEKSSSTWRAAASNIGAGCAGSCSSTCSCACSRGQQETIEDVNAAGTPGSRRHVCGGAADAVLPCMKMPAFPTSGTSTAALASALPSASGAASLALPPSPPPCAGSSPTAPATAAACSGCSAGCRSLVAANAAAQASQVAVVSVLCLVCASKRPQKWSGSCRREAAPNAGRASRDRLSGRGFEVRKRFLQTGAPAAQLRQC